MLVAIKAVIFDFDGTLAESMGVWRGLEEDLCRMSGAEDTEQVVRDLCPLTIPEVAAYFHEGFGLAESNEAVIAIIDDIMSQRYAHDVIAKPGALDLVRALHEAGIPMVVVSSTPHHLLDIGLGALGMAPYMTGVVSVDDVGHSKREPHAFMEACRIVGAEPFETLVFEDSVYAIETAKAAGMATFGVFDMDESGTVEQLREAADDFDMTLEAADLRRLQAIAL